MTAGQKQWVRLLQTAVAYVFGILTVLPFVWMVCTSLKTQREVNSASFQLLPSTWEWGNYAKAFQVAPLWTYLGNSAYISLVTTAGVVVTSLLAGYALSRLHFPGRNLVFIAILGTMMIPHQAIMIPSFILLKNFGWIDTMQSLIVPFLVYPFTIFIMRNFFLLVPKELEEAAYLDGCGRLQTLIRIFIPISMPAVASVVIFNFTHVWNDFFWPLVMTKSVEVRTIQVGLALLKNEFALRWPLLMAVTVLSSIPIFIVYIAFQRFFVQGSLSSAVKG